MNKYFCISVLIALLITSCGTKKNIPGAIPSNAKATKVIKEHYAKTPNFSTIRGKIRATYESPDKTQSANLSFRMKKDEAVWVSASLLGFSMAKVYITPEKVSYYEKVGKSYFDGDFRLLTDWLQTPLDFEKVQNLLIGQSIYDLRDDKYKVSVSERGFQLTPKREEAIKKMFLLDLKNYQINAQQLTQEDKNQSVTVTYSDYQTIQGVRFPKTIKIIANEGGKNTNITLEYRNLEFDKPVSFPFEIPSGYDEISVE